MFSKRYEIQVIYKAHGPGRRWRTFHTANVSYTLGAARRELDYWEDHEWNVVGDPPTFRIFDRKTGRPVQ